MIRAADTCPVECTANPCLPAAEHRLTFEPSPLAVVTTCLQYGGCVARCNLNPQKRIYAQSRIASGGHSVLLVFLASSRQAGMRYEVWLDSGVGGPSGAAMPRLSRSHSPMFPPFSLLWTETSGKRAMLQCYTGELKLMSATERTAECLARRHAAKVHCAGSSAAAGATSSAAGWSKVAPYTCCASAIASLASAAKGGQGHERQWVG